MRLTELNPRWWASEGRHGQGITFRCPHCPPDTVVVLGVAFANPVDGGEPATDPLGPNDIIAVRPHWNRTGDTFETLTLTPSILFHGHWHGFITNGEVITV
jgi:hypothetical protein